MSPDSLLLSLRRHHRIATAQLLAEFGVSRATLMRAVQAAGASVLTIGRARRTSYAARRLLRGSSAPLPVFRVDRQASAEQAGELHLAHPDGCLLEYRSALEWPLDADMRDGWFDGIAYPLQDLRPEGFLGRAFARENAAVLQVSEDPRAWSDDDVLHALTLLGSDLSGNYIVGESAYRLWLEQLQRPLQLVHDKQLRATYPDLAERAMQQGVEGSSAGGEFPKFTAVREQGAQPIHVIVKFSGSDESPGTERWADLLVCEQLASQCVANLPGLRAARSSIHRFSGRTFLEVERFDRHGAHGRSALCSWAAVNNAWFGLSGRPWSEGAGRLLERGLIASETRDAITRLWHFGQLIGNTDMHDGNLSFVPGEPGLRLAPVYDMLPMLYAPQRGVELPQRQFAARLPLPAEREHWHQAAQAALAFWSRASNDTRISENFRQICRRNERIVRDSSSLPVATI
jgi:HipA-like C-terminal domain